MKTKDFSFDLPRVLIAQEPLKDRSLARMMVVHRGAGAIEHKNVSDLPEYLGTGDLLVVNDTRVIPARVFGRRIDTGGRVELLLVEKQDECQFRDAVQGNSPSAEIWDCFYRASGRPCAGLKLRFANGKLAGEVLSVRENGRVSIILSGEKSVQEILETDGFAPVPPYIHRLKEQSPESEMDRQCYQTVYALRPGAVAAPTAGLHFTSKLLKALEDKGVRRTAVTLHVGPGTFKPVKTDMVEDHQVESERYEVSRETADLFTSTRQNGGRIIAAGSTTVRTLETVMKERGGVVPCSGRTSLFIYPPYDFKTVDVMLTNFHLPESSLLMMVSALAGRDLIMKAYAEAIQQKYRFYSYGDCMLIM